MPCFSAPPCAKQEMNTRIFLPCTRWILALASYLRRLPRRAGRAVSLDAGPAIAVFDPVQQHQPRRRRAHRMVEDPVGALVVRNDAVMPGRIPFGIALEDRRVQKLEWAQCSLRATDHQSVVRSLAAAPVSRIKQV